MAQATITGPVKWFGFLNDPRPNKFKDNELQWTYKQGVESKDKLMIRQNKIKNKVNFDEELGDFITVTLSKFDKKGNENKFPKIVDLEGNPWDKTKWIGNLSVVETTFDLIRFGPFTTKEGTTVEGNKLAPAVIKILDYKPYKKADDQNAKPKRVGNEDWSNEDQD